MEYLLNCYISGTLCVWTFSVRKYYEYPNIDESSSRNIDPVSARRIAMAQPQISRFHRSEFMFASILLGRWIRGLIRGKYSRRRANLVNLSANYRGVPRPLRNSAVRVRILGRALINPALPLGPRRCRGRRVGFKGFATGSLCPPSFELPTGFLKNLGRKSLATGFLAMGSLEVR